VNAYAEYNHRLQKFELGHVLGDGYCQNCNDIVTIDSVNEEVISTYEVMIQATITKSVVVDATCKSEAEELAHQMFDCNNDGSDENYKQETVGETERVS